ncbi:Concanavalin A-like lectin/glucanase domain [Trichophyton rubrum]|nr:Concanavalin A-like lectin/glucanase domain [Trichophyton rubrum]
MRILASLTLLPAVLAADIKVQMLYQRVMAVTMTTTKSAPPTEWEVCCMDGSYCPQDTYCIDTGCCPIEYTLKQCGGHEVRNYDPPPGEDSSTTRRLSSTSTSESITSSSTNSAVTSSGSAQPSGPSSSNDKDGNGASKKVSAIIGGVVGAIAIVGAVVIGVVWLILRSRAKEKAARAATAEGGADNGMEFKTQAPYGSGEPRQTASRSVMGYYAPSTLALTEATSSTPFYNVSTPRRVTELDAEGIYHINPTSSSVADDVLSPSSEGQLSKDTK